LAETPDFPKHQKKAIINRVLLALDVNLTNEFPILNFAQFQTLKKAIIYRDLPNAEMTEFVIKVRHFPLFLTHYPFPLVFQTWRSKSVCSAIFESFERFN